MAIPRALALPRLSGFPPSLQSEAAALRSAPFLTTRVVETADELCRLRPVWEALYAATDSSNPFTQWAWVWHWWQAFAQNRPLRRDRLHILVFSDHERAQAIVPFVQTTWGTGPCAIRLLRLYGFGGNLTELPAPLVRPGWERATVGALADRLLAKPRAYHWCALDGIPSGSALDHCLSAHVLAGDESWGIAAQDYVPPLPGTWDEFRAGLKRNIKESLRHCYNSLAREGHAWTFEEVTDPAALPAALNEFFLLHAARATMADGQPHPDHYASPKSRLFLQGLAQSLAPVQGVRVCRLRINGAVVASRILFVGGGCVYLSHSGFDPAWKRYSVMTTLTAECIKKAIADGAQTVNLSTGTDTSKLRWGPQERTFRSLRLIAPTPGARTLAAAHRRAVGN